MTEDDDDFVRNASKQTDKQKKTSLPTQSIFISNSNKNNNQSGVESPVFLKGFLRLCSARTVQNTYTHTQRPKNPYTS